jgi:hypothetical protein
MLPPFQFDGFSYNQGTPVVAGDGTLVEEWLRLAIRGCPTTSGHVGGRSSDRT